MKTIAVSNQKGGVGKTSTATNLAYCLASMGYKVIAIDLDPQAHMTLIYDQTFVELISISEMFSKSNLGFQFITLHATHDKNYINNLWLAPSSIHLAMAAEIASTRLHREKILHRNLGYIKDSYHYAIIDCPPNLGVLSVNAIYAADHIVIPVNFSRYAIQGMNDLISVISEVREDSSLDYSILRNSCDSRCSVTNRIIEESMLGPLYRDNLLDSVIRKCESINQAQINGESVFTFDPNGLAVVDYVSLAQELLRKLDYGKKET